MVRKTGLGITLLFFLLFWAGSVRADIYKWVDPKGTLHLTNVPNHSGYRPFAGLGKFAVQKFDHHIQRAAGRHGLDPRLVNAIIRAESDYQASAVSDKGAVGLMQLMPETAADMGVDDPLDPEDNIEGGTRYLAYLLKRYGKMDLAVAAYNAGPNNVDKYQGIPPFKETKTFVARVMQNYQSGQ